MNRKNVKIEYVLMLSVIAGIISGAFGAFLVLNYQSTDANALIKGFYETETAVRASPHHIRKAMSEGDESFILVDLRSREEYEKEYIAGAVSIPAYKDKYTSAYGEEERIINSFKTLQDNNPGKEIIVYCYSMPCMTGRKIGKMLAEHGIYVKILGIGWNEWRYFWNLWNHEHEWNETNVMNYISTGSKPGKPAIKNLASTCAKGNFGC